MPKTVGRVLWTGQGVSLCTIEDAPAQAKPEPVATPAQAPVDDDAGPTTALDFF